MCTQGTFSTWEGRRGDEEVQKGHNIVAGHLIHDLPQAQLLLLHWEGEAAVMHACMRKSYRGCKNN